MVQHILAYIILASKIRAMNLNMSDLSDIISFFNRVDDDGLDIPKFFCDGYGKMQPAAGFEVIAEHIVSLIS